MGAERRAVVTQGVSIGAIVLAVATAAGSWLEIQAAKERGSVADGRAGAVYEVLVERSNSQAERIADLKADLRLLQDAVARLEGARAAEDALPPPARPAARGRRPGRAPDPVPVAERTVPPDTTGEKPSSSPPEPAFDYVPLPASLDGLMEQRAD